MLSVDQIDKSRCTGCHACVSVCPLDAIVMEFSDDGFLYPQIDSQRCVHCSKCYSVCPTTKEYAYRPYLKCYSCYSKDREVLKASSSGGVFYYLAQLFLLSGGVVFGSAYDAKTYECKHVSTDNVPLSVIMRSKYVQSRICDSFSKVLEALEDNRSVLFCGTPCQVRGLKAYLDCKNCKKSSLFTIDFMCHGVPSPMFFKESIQFLEQVKGDLVTDFTFREKDLGWRTQVEKAYFKNGDLWKCKSFDYYYYFFFVNNYSLRDSCYSCEEYCSHLSDITLADDWVSNADKNESGTSLLFVNTDKGLEFYKKIQEKIVAQEVCVDVKIYSHKEYQYNKPIWMAAWKERGLSYVSGKLFRKLKRRSNLKKIMKYCGNRFKRVLKLFKLFG